MPVNQLSEQYQKPIPDREYETLRRVIMREFQQKLDFYAEPLLSGKSEDITQVKRLSAAREAWAEAFGAVDAAIRSHAIGEFNDQE